MDFIQPSETYTQRAAIFQAEANRQGRNAQHLSWIRVVLFLAIVVNMVFWIKSSFTESTWMILLSLLVVVFIYLIRLYQRVKDLQKRAQLLTRINKEEVACLHGDATGWEDGARFTENNPLADDLDLFGKNSLFPAFSRAGTAYGQELVARWLLYPLLNKEDILDRQTATREQMPAIDFRQELLMQALWEEPTPIPVTSLQAWMEEPPFLHSYWRMVAWAWPVIMLAGSWISWKTGHWSFLILLIVLALILVGSFQKKIQPMHEAISGYSRQFSNASALLKLICSHSFTHPLLKDIKSRAGGGSMALHRLGKLAHALDGRLNGIAFILTNSIWLQDIHVVLQIEDWKKMHRDQWQNWFSAIAKLEGLHTLANWAYNHPEGAWPLPVSDGRWEVEGLSHPLIPPAVRVANDLQLPSKVKTVLITGSNMAGKSTFLRTIGVNVLLAQMGTMVTASSMIWQPRRLFTSLRVNDSLAESTSFFMAELKKLKGILDELENGTPALVLLDEVLKGTNSDDKQYGAEQLIERLLKLPALTFLASHITEMGVLSERHPGEVVNCCFESTIQDQHLHFDYKLRPGIARNKNATFLMQQMGIIKK